MIPLHEAEGEVNESNEMRQAGSEWRRCRIKKLGEEEDHARTGLAVVVGERVPHWLHLWPIKHLGPVGGEARKGGGLASVEGCPSSLLGDLATQEALLHWDHQG